MKKEVGEEGRDWRWLLPRRRVQPGPFVLKLFSLSLAGRNLREGLRGRFQQNVHQFSRCVLSGS